ncbi:MAG: RDD family protein [Myxococcota bacterium]
MSAVDSIHRVETPEGVHLDLRTAGPLARGLAWLIDFMARMLVAFGIGIPLSYLGYFGDGMMWLLLFALEWLYPMLFEVYRDGSTPGKQLLDLRVVQLDGTPVGWAASFTRNLLRAADFAPWLYGTGVLSALMSDKFQRLGDIAAGTLVVYRSGVVGTRVSVSVTPHPPAAELTLEEQRAIIAFAQRLHRIPSARAEELAQIVAPWVLPVDYRDDPVTGLASVAAWLLGERPVAPAEDAA